MNHWNRFVVAASLMIFLALAVSGCSTFDSTENPNETSMLSLSVITVPSDNVEALYAAVYDEIGDPRDNVEINLEPGNFQLDTSKPFGGRLVLGENTILRSSLKMEVDANGVPKADDNGNPIVLEAGARIDSTAIESTFFGMPIIEVGDKGLVEQLWVDGGDNPFSEPISGIAITAEGTVREVYSTGHFIGVQVRAGDVEANGTVEENFVTGNVLGISVVGIEPTLDPTGSDARVRANLLRNASLNNELFNFNVIGGFGSFNNEIKVTAVHNIFRGASLANIRVISGTDFFNTPGSDNNEVKVTLDDNLIADSELGLQLSGAILQFVGPFPLEEKYSSNNEAKVTISNTTFENNSTDIVVYGSWSRTGEPGGGENNEAKVIIMGSDPAEFSIETHDCFPEDLFATCENEAKVKFVDMDDDDDDDE